ncbi:tRNA (adenine(22)-N(1))-methyltransferase [Neobacillus sp. LXY-1]|uniref:tRNA (adenine(22)-N(1))-methyltransferase n=1 Tax=Neobacillus sp. LXY-1 TaxID=3379133 RepID=UPI003EE22E57
MNTNQLSARLSVVAKYVPQEYRVADIGSDHAYLPCYLVKNVGIPFAVAGEVALGPFQSAERNVISEGLSEKISVRMGDGLEVIQPGDVDCITIAGMGGALITSILENGKDKLASIKRLILQPNIGAHSIRSWFIENGWELKAEEIIEEDGKIYEIIVGEKGDVKRPYGDNVEQQLLMGPILLENQNDAFQKKWSAELSNWQRVIKQLNQAAQTPETQDKKNEILAKMNLVEEALKYENS